MGFTTFNLIEGVFWITLGVASVIIYFVANAKYKKLALTAAAVLTLFGVSDFTEIMAEESFFDSISWLLLWKIAGVLGIIAVIAWYIKLRLSKT